MKELLKSLLDAFTAWYGNYKERQEVKREESQIKAINYADMVFMDLDIEFVHGYLKGVLMSREDWDKWVHMRNMFNYAKGRYSKHRKKF